MGGNTPIDNNRQVFSIASSTGFRLGSRNDAGVKKLGLELGYSYDSNSRGIDDVEPVPDLDSNGGKTFDAIYLQQYLYDRTRYGFAGSLDYNMSPGTDLYAHGLFSSFRDYGEKYAYQLKAGSKSAYHTSVRRPNLQIAELALGASHVFEHSYLKYQIAGAHSRFGEAAGKPGAKFKGTSATNDCAYAPATSTEYRPQFNCSVAGDPAVNLANYKLQTIDLTSGQATQLNLQGNLTYGRNYHLGTHASTLEFGGQFRNEHKGRMLTLPSTTPISGPLPAAISAASRIHTSTVEATRWLRLRTSPPLLETWRPSLPTSPWMKAPTHLNSDAANYNLQERVSAGYITNTIELGRFHLQTGLRIEATNTSNTGYLVVNDANGNYVSTTSAWLWIVCESTAQCAASLSN